MNQTRMILIQTTVGIYLALGFGQTSIASGVHERTSSGKQLPVEALIYSTMPSTWEHRPAMAMDGDLSSTFQSDGGMDDGDTFLVLLSRPISVQSIQVSTGDSDGNDRLVDAQLQTSVDAVSFTRVADFGKEGIASSDLRNRMVAALRIRMNPRKGSPKLVIKEIAILSFTTISHVQYGPGRGFYDVSQSPDLAGWAAKAESEMEAFWPD